MAKDQRGERHWIGDNVYDVDVLPAGGHFNLSWFCQYCPAFTQEPSGHASAQDALDAGMAIVRCHHAERHT